MVETKTMKGYNHNIVHPEKNSLILICDPLFVITDISLSRTCLKDFSCGLFIMIMD